MSNCDMKRILLPIIALLAAVPVSARTFPDGSAVDRWFSQAQAPLPAGERVRFVVTDYGVVRDSTVLQTKAIQDVIDAAAANGGTVVIPEGVFLTSSLFFKPHTHLYLEKGAVLKGSDDVSDYAVAKVHIEGVIQNYIAALINAYGVDGFTISGEGVIDGNGLRYWRDFWKRRQVNRQCTNLEALRPRLLYVTDASDIAIRGVTLKDSGYWTMHLYKCRRVRIEGVSISAPVAPVAAPSSDGIDLDACSLVHVKGCTISVNDDIIAMKGGKGPWADTDPDNGTNSRIIIENCVFGHGPGVLTCGSECIGASNIILRDCEVHGADRLVWLKMRPDTPQHYENILVERIRGEVGSVIQVRPWTQFFDLKGREDIPKSYASNIVIRDCDLDCDKVLDIQEDPGQYEISGLVVEGFEDREKAR